MPISMASANPKNASTHTSEYQETIRSTEAPSLSMTAPTDVLVGSAAHTDRQTLLLNVQPLSKDPQDVMHVGSWVPCGSPLLAVRPEETNRLLFHTACVNYQTPGLRVACKSTRYMPLERGSMKKMDETETNPLHLLRASLYRQANQGQL